ncbi:phage capsid protein [Bifidobacterium lemurum]|uniref:Phage capsid protein n=1 Tax=Bifidobacterium lemurum TaxID=1603886 RepID=A0A261FUR5_9BIFI|nr:HK97 family phage prohead protease [Bifidobacterium lemurum]OZG62685.1 phage capsid protein [Bifidobacterium lemurum]QOL34598.1 HK97 family phage prohead protease [Bifidobacterium lemurum]
MPNDLMARRELTIGGLSLRASDASGDGRTIEGVAVPFNTRYKLWGDYAEVFDPDTDFGSRQSVKISRGHGDLIGKVTDMRAEPDGLHITARLSDTPSARETAQLIRDGVYDGLSVGFAPVENRTEYTDDGITEVHRRKVDLFEVAVTGIPAYPDAAITGQRDATNTQTTTTTTERNTTMNIEDILEKIQTMDEQTRSALADLSARVDRPAPSALGSQWRSAGDYLKALEAGDEQAVEFQRDARDLITSPDAHNANVWVADQIRLVQSRRSVANMFVHQALPASGMTVEYLTLGTDTMKVAKQATEGDALAFGKVTLSSQTSNVETYGGYTTLSRQVIERSTAPALSTALRAMTIAYATATETAARDYLASAIAGATANQITTPAAPSSLTADQWIGVIIDAAEAVDARGAQIGTLAVGKDVFTAMAKLTRSGNALMDVSGRGSDTIGTMDLSDVTGQVFRVGVRMLPGAAADTAAFIDPEALTMWEAGGPFQLQQMNARALTDDYAVYGYAAFGTTFPGGIAPLASA